MERRRATLVLLLMSIGMALATAVAIEAVSQMDIADSALQRTLEDFHAGRPVAVAAPAVTFGLLGLFILGQPKRASKILAVLMGVEAAYVLWFVTASSIAHLREGDLQLLPGPTLLAWAISIVPFLLLVGCYVLTRLQSSTASCLNFLWCLVFYWANLGGIALFVYRARY